VMLSASGSGECVRAAGGDIERERADAVAPRDGVALLAGGAGLGERTGEADVDGAGGDAAGERAL
jgi:hypothetical protein